MTSFKHWLAHNQHNFRQQAEQIVLPTRILGWFKLMDAAFNQQNLLPILKEAALSPGIIAKLFDLTAKMMPADQPVLWHTLVYLQNQILNAADELRPSSFSPQQEIEALTTLAQRLWQSEHPDQLLDQARQAIADIFNYRNLNLFALEGADCQIVLQTGLWDNVVPSLEDSIIFSRIIATSKNSVQTAVERGQLIHRHKPNYTAPQPMHDIVEEIVAPIRSRNQSFGAIQLFSHIAGQLSDQDEYLLQAIANQIAMAMENTQLQRNIQRQIKEKKILLESQTALVSSFDLSQILSQLTIKMTDALQAGACVISEWHPTDKRLVPVAQHLHPHKNNPRHTGRKLNQAIPLHVERTSQRALNTLRPLSIHAIQIKQTTMPPHQLPTWVEVGWGVILVFPLQSKQEKLGLIEIFDRDPNRIFTQDDIDLGRAIANQASVIIERIRLFEETQQRLVEVSTLFTLSKSITSSLDLAHMLNNIVRAMRQITDCRACVLFLLDESGQYLEIKAADGLKSHWREAAKLAVGEGAAGHAVANRETINIADTTQDPDYIFFDQSVRSLIVVPLIFQDQVIGAINLDDVVPNAFGQAQERLLSIAANQAAIAIKNAMLFDQVRSEERRMSAIIQNMADGLLMLSKEGLIVTVNDALLSMLGMHSGEVLGKNIFMGHLHPRLAAIGQFARADLNQADDDSRSMHEITLPGKPPAILQIFPTKVTNLEGEALGRVLIVHNVTQERELERMRDDFISTITHELRTPLFSIQGFARLILDGDAPDEETHKEFLSIIERQTTQLTGLVNNIIDMNKLSQGTLSIDKEVVQLGDIIHQTVLKLQGYAYQRKVKLASDVDDNLPPVLADPTRIDQVLTNLLGNAIKFTPEGGEVRIQAAHTDETITIAVNDTGIGIPADNLDKIFSKFYQVESGAARKSPGSGLGLHIAKQLIERHDGRIWATSEPQKGSTFYVTLPVATTHQQVSWSHVKEQ